MEAVNDTEGGAYAGGGQGSRIAVGQNAKVLSPLEQVGPMVGHGTAEGLVFSFDGLGSCS